ncbi:Zip-domain-containing protein [Mollisia scopiformis]|uniref:Zip-domain-containing protein n=1 Tax=Mollisia scopiformis TaxID=149040 RepID=A0A132B3Y3_MOLSC|nr:Zip-domain-containing protein [Mollisia scopiformis]KUJ07100.1 Zip-domain-containing protein [Mollisia scopiformis]
MVEHIDNDTRGWIMCVVSGIACVLGASIICVDVLIRYIPSMRNFKIQESGAFLAASMSLSFGVMLFSALYSMLPSSKKYLILSGFTPSAAAWILLAGFLGGFVGIQIVSRFLHHYMPSHAVGCDHTHEEGHHDHDHSHTNGKGHSHAAHGGINGHAHESTPLLSAQNETSSKLSPHRHGQGFGGDGASQSRGKKASKDKKNKKSGDDDTKSDKRRPSMVEVQKRVMSFVKDTKPNCDSTGPCFGYTDPCGQGCFKFNVNSRRSTIPSRISSSTSLAAAPEIEVVPACSASRTSKPHVHLHEEDDEACESDDEDLEAQHHHHVPENEFLSIGLQTSIAIALHKLPEGFITYATNHANPSLGFSVFMALFVHNITEGFALALPLFLALNSRLRAMFWASLLGGVSQPLGAGIAAAWFKIAGREGHAPGHAVYGTMFAITAGIMTSVALQLFVEGLSLNHNRNLCIAFGFIGMGIMGTSNALTS